MPVTVCALSCSRGVWNWGLSLRQIRAACPEQEKLLCPTIGAAGEFHNCFSAAALPCLDPRLCHFSAVPLQLGLEWLPGRIQELLEYQLGAVKGKATCTGLRL